MEGFTKFGWAGAAGSFFLLSQWYLAGPTSAKRITITFINLVAGLSSLVAFPLVRKANQPSREQEEEEGKQGDTRRPEKSVLRRYWDALSKNNVFRRDQVSFAFYPKSRSGAKFFMEKQTLLFF